MFGRKIPDKVMGGPPGASPVKENTTKASKAAAERPVSLARAEVPPKRTGGGAVGTVLGEDTVFKGGKIVSKGTLRIDGSVEGEIIAEDSVVVGPTGTVKANITARSVAVSGKVFGNIIARERLELQPTSEVHGDVQTAAGALIIEGGAKLEGRCIMGISEERREAGGQKQPSSRQAEPKIEASTANPQRKK